MKALLVIDMQEEYIGENRNKMLFSYHADELISNINQRIQEYYDEGNMVVYVLNSYFFQSKKYVPHIVRGINIVSDHKYIKRRMNSFSNAELINFLKNNNVDEVELTGVDGNLCIAASARGGIENDFSVVFNTKCIEAKHKNKFRETINKLQKSGVKITQ